ncbi:retrovirus-related pol polyprotein from transposon TNT 1-94 [Tanacetum coccineum]|uniref:Retrovirus-related pol polyprotein from transposon TNT 1-94 n=1 Tax=Tanacetum coccineum TaxID=301880 RepID=A0ABQ5CC64_9ASTR
MELENSQNNALAKLPMLKLGEYEMWEIRIKQYFQIQDYALWEVIENGNSWVPIPVTAPESARFGGNEATKRTQKALLKQQYENFNASSSESLDSIFNRLQKLVSRLAILGVVTPLEDLNVKFLRSLPSKWDTHVNLAFLTTSSPSSTNTINTVNSGVSTGTTKVNTTSTKTSTASFSDATVYAFLSTQPQGSQLVHEDLEQLHDDDLEEMDLKWNMALLSMRARKFYQRTRRMIIIDGSNIAGYDKSKVECFNCHKMGHFARECRAPRSKDNKNWNQGSSSKAVKIEDASEKAMCAINGAGFDWILKSSKDLDDLLASQVTDKSKKGFGYNAVPSPHPLILNRPTPLDLSYSGLEEFKQPEVNEYGPRDSSLKPTTVCDRESDNSKENTDDSLKQQHKIVTKTSSVKSPLKVDKDWKEKFFYPANHVREEEPKKARENTDAPIIEDWVSDDEEEVEPIPKVEKKTAIPTATKKESVKPEKPIRRSVKYAREVQVTGPRGKPKEIGWSKKSTQLGFVLMAHKPYGVGFLGAVLMKTGLKTINNARPVNTVRQNVNTVRARGFNAVKPSACWVWRPIKPNGASLSNSQLNDKGFVDSGCSRHMSRNIAHISNFKDFDGGKSKKASHPLKAENTNTEVLHTLHMDLCGPMRTESINGKKYVLVIVDDFTRFGWVRFLRTKDETPQVVEKFIVKTQRALNATVRFVRTDNGTEFVNKTLDGWFESVGISHETSVPRSPQQNGVVERRGNKTLMEAARTMLIFAKAPLFLWAEAVATACYTLNRSLVHTLHGKTYYELLKGKKPNLQYFRVFGSLCYPTNDYDDVGKLKAKADIGIFVGYAPTKKAYRIYNKRTRKIQETVHVTFDELTEGLTSVQTSSGLAPQQMTSVPNSTELELTALQSGRSRSALVKDPEPPSVPPTKKQVDDLFQWFDDDEVVPITPVNVPAAPAPENANGSPSTTVISEGAPAVTESLLPHQVPLPDTSDSDVETLFDHVDSNVFDTYNAPETDSEASPSNSVNIDVTPNNQLPHVQKWTQAHPLENIIGDKDRPVSTRKQLETDAMWCFFNEFLTHVEPKTYKQALEHSCWIEAMQEEIHEFERLDVWILVPCPDNILIIPLKWIFKINEKMKIQKDV